MEHERWGRLSGRKKQRGNNSKQGSTDPVTPCNAEGERKNVQNFKILLLSTCLIKVQGPKHKLKKVKDQDNKSYNGIIY